MAVAKIRPLKIKMMNNMREVLKQKNQQIKIQIMQVETLPELTILQSQLNQQQKQEPRKADLWIKSMIIHQWVK
tara:strand:+ start:282 stop:503 length:222 start_codon:yes stop_codon:yes gene_type:complete